MVAQNVTIGEYNFERQITFKYRRNINSNPEWKLKSVISSKNILWKTKITSYKKVIWFS